MHANTVLSASNDDSKIVAYKSPFRKIMSISVSPAGNDASCLQNLNVACRTLSGGIRLGNSNSALSFGSIQLLIESGVYTEPAELVFVGKPLVVRIADGHGSAEIHCTAPSVFSERSCVRIGPFVRSVFGSLHVNGPILIDNGRLLIGRSNCNVDRGTCLPSLSSDTSTTPLVFESKLAPNFESELLIRDSPFVAFNKITLLSTGPGAERTANSLLSILRSTVQLQIAQISSASVAGNGGGVWITESVVSGDSIAVSNCVAASLGGGIYARDSTLKVAKLDITSNAAVSGGGAFFSASEVTITESLTVTGNQASSDCGGLEAEDQAVLVVSGVAVVKSNVAGGNGGGLCVIESTTELTGPSSSFSNNNAAAGGGIFLFSSSLSALAGGNLSYNNATVSFGGGMLCTHTLLSAAT